MTESSSQDDPVTPIPAGRRIAVRWFMLVITAFIAVDAGPGAFPVVARAKQVVSPILTRIGLWQGEWTLFAPNPAINNAWVSAEIRDPNGELETWNSTYWAGTSGWERFRGFRYINYSNRLPTQDQAVADDYADYLARQLISPTAQPLNLSPDASSNASPPTQTPAEAWKLSLFRSQLNLSLPEDGSLPPRDEVLWISTSKNLAIREYLP
jgi:hypothetical protein